ncbi:WhiB family transcriptional regulator [Nonomuraea sp. CA-218870]|uniref:WhiB family transcriptional regulator n=1 Tax=Nonomuraea sp. CA-218870 TaxID=3239998 RepID=UPI003D923FEB
MRDWSWQDSAACQGQDVRLFVGRDGERSTEKSYREQAVKQEFCSWCPIVNACLDHAISVGEHGVWGGMTDEERAKERRRRMRRAAHTEQPTPVAADDKRCRCCDEVKPATDFHKDRRNSDGLNPYCKPCTNTQKRIFRDRKRRTRKKVA